MATSMEHSSQLVDASATLESQGLCNKARHVTLLPAALGDRVCVRKREREREREREKETLTVKQPH